jgi:hypothetical protein
VAVAHSLQQSLSGVILELLCLADVAPDGIHALVAADIHHPKDRRTTAVVPFKKKPSEVQAPEG